MPNLSVAFAPVYHNPYQHLLTAALQKQNVTVHHLDAMPSLRWLRAHRSRVAILHLHWLYGLYMRHLLTPARYAAFLARFHYARRLGYKIVWTAHNILPHRMPFPPMHRYVRRLMMQQAEAVIVHCEYGRSQLRALFPRQKPIHTVPIGTYAGVYPDDVSRSTARQHLQVAPEQFVYLFLGNISAYKGLRKFVQIFLAQAGPNDLALIAGRNRDGRLVADLEEQAAQEVRLCVYAQFIPDEEMQYFLRAADVMVAPFTKILTSSSVIVGMAYGLPVIVPDLGCMPELVTPAAGIVYPASAPDGLAEALAEIKQRNTAVMGQAGQQIASQLDWDDIAAQTAAIYRQVINA
jgi:glycosyltransferase involved in cell wall biosynthesis